MININWDEVQEAVTDSKLPAGAYALKIIAVEDKPDQQRLLITYDITDGQYANKYKDSKPDDYWRHSFSQSYSEKARPFFKSFLKELEKDNPGFTVSAWQQASDPQAFKNLKLGMLFRDYYYFNDKGEAKVRLDGFRPLSLDRIKNGDWTMPDPSFQRGTDAADYSGLLGSCNEAEEKTTTTQDSIYSDVPF